jgi:L-alanine-DL-glutamate epimerase-like enolase superfamily enzyme
MKIVGFRVYSIEIPMRFGVTHSLAGREVTSNVIVCAVGDNGVVGFGECCPRVYVTGETVETVMLELSENILPSMSGESFSSFSGVVEYLSSMLPDIKRNRQSAFCAAELAILDLAGKTFSQSSADMIGLAIVPKTRYSGVIATGDPVNAGRFAKAMRIFGFKDIKIKVGLLLEGNLEVLEKVRANAGPRINLRIDANCVWQGEEAIRQLEAMEKFSLTGVEQPVPADDFEGMAKVTAAKLVDVVADESLCSIADAEKLIAMKACDVFNIRVSKCGGLINSAAIHRMAVEAGLSCQVGAQVGETAILSAAGRHLATRCKSIKWCEGSYGCFLLKHEISRQSMTLGLGGWAKSIVREGLGVDPIEKRIDKYKIEMIEVPGEAVQLKR